MSMRESRFKIIRSILYTIEAIWLLLASTFRTLQYFLDDKLQLARGKYQNALETVRNNLLMIIAPIVIMFSISYWTYNKKIEKKYAKWIKSNRLSKYIRKSFGDSQYWTLPEISDQNLIVARLRANSPAKTEHLTLTDKIKDFLEYSSFGKSCYAAYNSLLRFSTIFWLFFITLSVENSSLYDLFISGGILTPAGIIFFLIPFLTSIITFIDVYINASNQKSSQATEKETTIAKAVYHLMKIKRVDASENAVDFKKENHTQSDTLEYTNKMRSRSKLVIGVVIAATGVVIVSAMFSDIYFIIDVISQIGTSMGAKSGLQAFLIPVSLAIGIIYFAKKMIDLAAMEFKLSRLKSEKQEKFSEYTKLLEEVNKLKSKSKLNENAKKILESNSCKEVYIDYHHKKMTKRIKNKYAGSTGLSKLYLLVRISYENINHIVKKFILVGSPNYTCALKFLGVTFTALYVARLMNDINLYATIFGSAAIANPVVTAAIIITFTIIWITLSYLKDHHENKAKEIINLLENIDDKIEELKIQKELYVHYESREIQRAITRSDTTFYQSKNDLGSSLGLKFKQRKPNDDNMVTCRENTDDSNENFVHKVNNKQDKTITNINIYRNKS